MFSHDLLALQEVAVAQRSAAYVAANSQRGYHYQMPKESLPKFELRGVQSKMARVALGWGVRDLANAAGISTNTVSRFEGDEQLKQITVAAIRAALEAAGVIFVDQNGGGPGVRLRDAEP